MGHHEFEYTMEMLQTVLQIISDVCWFEYQDICNDQFVDVYKLWKESDYLIKSLLIRAFYKGRTCDIKRLQGFAEIWFLRRKNEKWLDFLQNAYKDFPVFSNDEVSGVFCFDDATVEGIDVNCSDMLSQLLKNEKLVASLIQLQIHNLEEYLVTSIWDKRSGVNKKKFLCDCELVCELFSERVGKEIVCDEVFDRVVLPLVNAYARKFLFKKFFI